jgi:hypothetical protein
LYTSQVVTTTSADGLTVTTQSDLVGDADFDGTSQPPGRSPG